MSRSRLAPALRQLVSREPASTWDAVTNLREFVAAAGASLSVARDQVSHIRSYTNGLAAEQPQQPPQQQHHHQLLQWRGFAAGSPTKKGTVRRLRNASARAAGARPAGPQTALQRAPAADVRPSAAEPAEVAVAGVVNHPALIVTRPVEWGTVLLGFEQANRYTVYDQDGSVVALIAEEEGSIGRAIGRQLLKTRRPFTATVFSPDGAWRSGGGGG